MVYVAFVVDAFARRVIGWRAATSMKTELVLDALEHAIFTRSQEGVTDLSGLVSHSDAGSQYVSIAFTQRLLEAGIDPSVGSVGDGGVPDVEVAAFEWVHFFNTIRPHEYLDDLTPAVAEKLHYDHFTPLPEAG